MPVIKRREKFQGSLSRIFRSIFRSEKDLRNPHRLKEELEKNDNFHDVSMSRDDISIYSVRAEGGFNPGTAIDLFNFVQNLGYNVSYDFFGSGLIRVEFEIIFNKHIKRNFN